jgi:hypothetical protein
MGLILDSSVVIAAERRGDGIEQVECPWSALHHTSSDSHKFRNELCEYCEKAKWLQRPALTAE